MTRIDMSTVGGLPNAMYVPVPQMSARNARQVSLRAVEIARAISPKLSGSAANGIDVFYGHGYYGIKWRAPYLWYVEHGTQPFTMRSLAGKTIPMWLDDPTGSIKRENPRAETRVMSGRRQTLIFRRAARQGERKRVTRTLPGGRVESRLVPRSWPGAPGRIARRTAPGGRIWSGPPRAHHGVRWRNPGIHGRQFLAHALRIAGQEAGLLIFNEPMAVYQNRPIFPGAA